MKEIHSVHVVLDLQVFIIEMDLALRTKLVSITEPPKEPCNPTPCGANSFCKVVNEVAVCSCQPGQIGNPPNCRPECVVSAECPLQQACLNNKCVDPCPGTCGINAKCQVVNHNPICSCMDGQTGDPFRHCYVAPGNFLSNFLIFIIKRYKF